MARPRSDDKRSAILAAATRVIASQGLGAATAAIAKEAGVSNGSLFTYFETKADLLNQLYVELKIEMAATALDGLPAGESIREQSFYMWSQWLHWATSHLEKRRTLEHLMVSGDITSNSHRIASDAFAGIRELLQRCREKGPLREASLGFAIAMMSKLAEATIDFMIQDPAHAEEHCMAGFEAFWRVVA